MAKDKISCDPKMLGRFFDRELEPDESVGVSGHIEDCNTCRGELRDNQFLSALFKAGVEEELSRANFQEMEESVVALIRTKRGLWWIHLKNLCLSKKLYVPAAAMAAALILFFHLARTPAPASGPSAIVNSLQGNFASVMILETQKSRQTILWIHEASDPWDNNGDATDQTRLRPFSTRYCLNFEKDRVGWQETIIDGINTC
ncbi:MAG: hypothetical protein JRJ47_14650 [Deltaproteobacteria bacterium]|nr:hypothetical protein [Deltaproteobacteria bacterium]